MTRARSGLLYAAAWLPFVAIWSLLVYEYRRSFVFALTAGSVMMGAAATMALGVYWLAQRDPWPERAHGLFVLRQVAGAVLFVVVLLVVDIVLAGIYDRRPPLTVLLERKPYHFLWDVTTFSWLYGLVAGLAHVLRVQQRLRERALAAAKAEALAASAQFQALRARLNPHFLFNALHSLSTLVRHDQAAAEAALDRLGELLRYTLHEGAEDEVALADEWRFARHYLDLEALRLGDRLRVQQELDPRALECPVPPFTLQPLIENAVRHGLAHLSAGGTVSVSTRVAGDELVLRVSDDGTGCTPEEAKDGAGSGLRSLRQRLAARYGRRAALDVRTAPGEGFTATVRLPASAEAFGVAV